ncbi:leucine zipper domain-containing protein [Bordetella pertussis]|uniref:leucine zipper domain-containing protein n=1 Tax=Bordetella pertussis TaxID=520 RepID=UPI001F34A25A|nr:leucine zipper domain-containing protein [Bordetella pertussis]
MNTHKHARLTFLRRLEMVQQLIARAWPMRPRARRSRPERLRRPRRWLSWSCAASG